MKSRHQSQLNLPPVPLGSSERTTPTFRESERSDGELGTSEQLAADLLDEAFKRAGLQNKEVAHLCGVSISLVEKWRKSDVRGCPSFVQLLLLPPVFHLELHRAMNRRFGFGRAALLELLEAAGALALVTER